MTSPKGEGPGLDRTSSIQILGISYNGYYDGFANHKLGFNSLYLHRIYRGVV